MVWDLGCWRIGAVWVLQGAIWGHRVTCEAKKRSLVSRRHQVGAGSENAVRRVLSELAGERWTIRLGGWWERRRLCDVFVGRWGCETVSGRVRTPDRPPHGPPGRCPPDAPITIAPQCPAVTPRRQREPAGGGTPSWRQIARAVPVGISRCRGTGDLRSRETLDQMAWLAPSRIGWQPCSRRCDSSSRLVKRRGRS